MWGPFRWGVRRLHALVTNLPPDSAFIRQSNHAQLGWDNNTELLATLCDIVFQFAQSFGEGNHPQGPIIERPWDHNAPPEVHLNELANLIGE